MRAALLACGAARAGGALAAHARFSLDAGWRLHRGAMPAPPRPCDAVAGFDIGTGFIAVAPTLSADACCAACGADARCAAWDWDTSAPFSCYLKDNAEGNVSKADRVTGLAPAPPALPVAPGFDDSAWARVDLPFDAAINGTFAATNEASHAYLPRDAAWWRKNFTLPADVRGGALVILCDAAMRNARVWLNGRALTPAPIESGYLPFAFDVTDAVVYGADNVLAVITDPSTDDEGTWWYEGAGLIRHWWLHAAPSRLTLPVAGGGIFVRADVPADGITDGGRTGARVRVLVTAVVLNGDAAAPVDGAVATLTVRDASGAAVGAVTVPVGRVPAGGNATVEGEIALAAPTALWAPDHPYLYTLETRVVLAGGAPADDAATRFGARLGVFTANDGFSLNGVRTQIRGFCQHEDVAGLGAALTVSVHRFRVAQLKSAGANGWRASHGPLSPELLDELDAQGVIVMAENRDARDAGALAAMVLRDRNHPSIFLWSLCNEVACMSAADGRPLVDLVHALDPTRPVTGALLAPNFGNSSSALAHSLDVLGINYADDDYDTIHANYPTTPMFASETSRCMIVRGVYSPLLNYSTIQSGDACMREFVSAVESRPWMAGMFIWVSADFMGEPKPVFWPQVGAIKGALVDSVLLPKDTFQQYAAWWTAAPVLHLLPHWNWAAGDAVVVWAYTNAAAVELFQDGASRGRQAVPPGGHAAWSLVFAAGNVTAVGFDAAGGVVATAAVATAGAPAALALSLENGPALVADGSSTGIVRVAVVDAAGAVVPTDARSVVFTVGAGSAGALAGVHNGDPLSHEPHQGGAHRVWMGLGRAWLRAGFAAGNITLTASADGLAPAALVVRVDAAPPQAPARL
jgi:beta-galactosidase